MEKIKNLFSSLYKLVFGINFALIAFAGLSVKSIFFNISIYDSIVFIPIIALYGYTLYLQSKKPNPVKLNAEVQGQINELNKRLSDAQMQSNLQKRQFKW